MNLKQKAAMIASKTSSTSLFLGGLIGGLFFVGSAVLVLMIFGRFLEGKEHKLARKRAKADIQVEAPLSA